MTKANCEICRGNGRVRLPIFRSVMAFSASEMPDASEEAYREYPCPECSDAVPIGRINALRDETFASSNYADDPKFTDHVKRALAHQLADYLMRYDYIGFERSPIDTIQMRFTMRATVGVVSKKVVATIEERTAQHQEALAREVMAEAGRQISNWESHYTGDEGRISKAQAIDSVRDSLRIVLEERAKWRAA